ncbi:hypothetical protein [Streptomyces sp. NBC_01275]|uniref:hypothetical protein n=1 Tax=Streptomyces sp. NBC_01275 TaxID=2903807 RepID=UPI002B1DE149|nr:hypothetical protein [Streptomyces sp. NBC_01275]
MFTEQLVLRGLAAAAAATAIGGAFVMRRWDMQAGKQVADLTRARAGDEWRFEERVAELETDLDESRELRVKLEQRLRAKRTELAGLRNEHAALLRRYATAETERASALEGRRLLEIETTDPAPALPPARVAQEKQKQEKAEGSGKSTATGTVAARELEAAADPADAETEAETEADSEALEPADGKAESDGKSGSAEAVESSEAADEEPEAPAVFSPAGSKLFLRAQAALALLDADADSAEAVKAEAVKSEAVKTEGSAGDTEAAQEDEAEGKPEAVDEHTRAAAAYTSAEENATPAEAEKATSEEPEEPEELEKPGSAAERTAAGAKTPVPEYAPSAYPRALASRALAESVVLAEPVVPDLPAAPTESAASGALVPRQAAPVMRPSGHFTVPTAVAVVPAAQPLRRPTAEGGFDFFGTKASSASAALEAVQNEDLADVVGQEALALHKAEAESEFKPVDEHARGVSQVIDLTAHDETEQINLHGLRSAAS